MIAALAAALIAQSGAPPLRPDFIRGVNFAHVHLPFYGYGSAKAAEQLDTLRGLGVDWIALSPFAYMRQVDQPELRFGELDPTLTAGDLVAQTEAAHARGIKVLFKPHVWSRDFYRGKWHGDIAMKTPQDTARFFEQYQQFIVEQAEIAARAKADALSIGLEYVQLTRPEHTARWRRLIAAVRDRYRGPLTYGAHHHQEAFQIEFWDALDAIGVHGYFPLSTSAGEGEVTAAEVAAAWAPHLDLLAPLAARFGKPIVLTEIGYPAHRGALREPWSSNGALPEDPRLQAIAYEGTLSALGARPFIRGVFWWKWFSGGAKNPGDSDPYQPTPAAESVLRRWFARPR
jgi:hypothetical protein